MRLPYIEDDTTKEPKKDFNIQDFPLTPVDPQDPHFAMDQFIETSIAVLDIENYDILYNGRYIYRQEEKYIRGRKTRTLKELIIEYQGTEGYWGLDLYLGLLNARLNDPFELQKVEVGAYDSYAKELRERLVGKLQLTDEMKKEKKINTYPTTFPLHENLKLELNKEEREGRYGRGRIKWTIAVPTQLLPSVMKNILEPGDIRDFKITDNGFVVRQINTTGYTYYVEAIGI